jgi:hypothetical protein
MKAIFLAVVRRKAPEQRLNSFDGSRFGRALRDDPREAHMIKVTKLLIPQRARLQGAEELGVSQMHRARHTIVIGHAPSASRGTG